jgi:hypothetical protein
MSQPSTTAAAVRDLARIAAELASVAARLAEDVRDPDDLIPVRDAAAEAQCSVRALTDARRAGDLAMYGTQRTRTVRRSDLLAWIESRRVRPVAGIDDLDMQRRIRRLEQRA